MKAQCGANMDAGGKTVAKLYAWEYYSSRYVLNFEKHFEDKAYSCSSNSVLYVLLKAQGVFLSKLLYGSLNLHSSCSHKFLLFSLIKLNDHMIISDTHQHVFIEEAGLFLKNPKP